MFNTDQNTSGPYSPNVNGDNNHLEYNIHGQLSSASEVRTIMNLILFIKAESELVEMKIETSKDLEIKFLRFDEYKEQLKGIMTELMPNYEPKYKEAKNEILSDEVETNRVVNYLRTKSIIYLDEANGNPIIALAKMCAFFEEKLSFQSHDHDFLAIKFYLIKELINCNVFPNIQ